eukprot:CAMPEP_0183291608 /NCGR_PEP_ID=MMETSP0160_2-20130417/967_1 /TAXON_ID=2839 ORGANISM="Odontella Sinensis, Strain Grunow 1884" /NCGR_SAMPLE_ID=MMETSP0160_2 /ASSEMBLY_ACC=CAM_ASM_000250 /LENGTH=517 /DNA_ID=CAMNT_0025452441 /DNA_START=79 /DNA_END=1629 /DNA_ORIENTATION=+
MNPSAGAALSSPPNRRRAVSVALALAVACLSSPSVEAFAPSRHPPAHLGFSAAASASSDGSLRMSARDGQSSTSNPLESAGKFLASAVATAALTAAVFLTPDAALAENELSARYGGKGFDTSLVDQTCLVDRCSLQAKACLADDPSCRKGLTCTAKCLGDNACITGCMARYGDENLDNLLKCTIEDNECIKVAILDGGADNFGEEPRAPAPTVRNFNLASMEGSWYKVVGFNPNYDCYACQRNTFSAPSQSGDSLQVDVEFSMPHLMPDGTPPPPKNVRESVRAEDGLMVGSQSIGFNDYSTHENMVFDNPNSISAETNLVLSKGTDNEVSYARTAHSEGEMFGLKFWENWYIIGENDPDQAEFKFVYYNGKTRQNTYEGAFVYSRTRDLDLTAMKKVYQIASDAGMNPDQFCKIRNGCFDTEKTVDAVKVVPVTGDGAVGTPSNPFRGILASTKVSELLGVEPVAAEGDILRQLSSGATPQVPESKRPWRYELGDYLENPHRHFKAMDSLRLIMDW